VKDYPPGHRVLTNVTNNPRRVGLFFGLPKGTGGIEIVRTFRDRFNRLEMIEPVEVRGASFEEEFQSGSDVDLYRFPAPFWHEHDGGRYIRTACSVVTRDPDRGWVNVGAYRVQLHDRRTLGLYIEEAIEAARATESDTTTGTIAARSTLCRWGSKTTSSSGAWRITNASALMAVSSPIATARSWRACGTAAP